MPETGTRVMFAHTRGNRGLRPRGIVSYLALLSGFWRRNKSQKEPTHLRANLPKLDVNVLSTAQGHITVNLFVRKCTHPFRLVGACSLASGKPSCLSSTTCPARKLGYRIHVILVTHNYGYIMAEAIEGNEQRGSADEILILMGETFPRIILRS